LLLIDGLHRAACAEQLGSGGLLTGRRRAAIVAHGIAAAHVMCGWAARHHTRLQGGTEPCQQKHTRQGASEACSQFAQSVQHFVAGFRFPMNRD